MDRTPTEKDHLTFCKEALATYEQLQWERTHGKGTRPGDTKHQCSICGEWKPRCEFHKNKVVIRGTASQCKVCKKARQGCGKRKRKEECTQCGATLDSSRGYADVLCRPCRTVSRRHGHHTPYGVLAELVKHMKSTTRQSRMGSDFGFVELVALLVKQQGLCALSGCALGLGQEDSFTQLSPDRIDPSIRRYTLDNVRLVMRAFQSAPTKGESEDDTVQWSRQKINACRMNHQDAQSSPLPLPPASRDFVKALLRSCRRHANKRKAIDKKRKVERRRGECTLTFAWFVSRWEKQRGRCAYSHMPMVCQAKRGWRCSIERLNNDLGYTPTNCVLICSELNTFAQWSREKFLKYVIGV